MYFVRSNTNIIHQYDLFFKTVTKFTLKSKSEASEGETGSAQAEQKRRTRDGSAPAGHRAAK